MTDIKRGGKHINYLVLTTQRTGSTWLIDLLNHQKEVEGHEELFHGKRRATPAMAGCDKYPRFIEKFDSPGLTRPAKVFSYLNGLYRRQGTVGFKLMYSQLKSYPEILFYMIFKPLRIIHLIRENHLDVIISLEMAKRTGRFHLAAGDKKADNVQIKINLDNLMANIRKLEGNIKMAKMLLKFNLSPVLEVTYEKLRNDPNEFSRICSFLNIETQNLILESNLQKRIDKRQSEIIMNYEEVKKILLKEGYENLLTG